MPLVEFIETPDRVFRAEITPDTPGVLPRTLTVSVESGPEWDETEATEIMTRCVVELVGRGYDVTEWELELEVPQ